MFEQKTHDYSCLMITKNDALDGFSASLRIPSNSRAPGVAII
jgi:hypothetical protein